MLLALLHPELVSRLVVVDIAPKSYGSLERFSGYIEEMQRLPLGELANRADAEARFEEPNAGVKAFLLQNLRRDGDSWRWQTNLELFAADAAKGTDSVIAAWPATAASLEPFPGPVLWIAGSDSTYITDEDLLRDAGAVPQGAPADRQGSDALGAHRRPRDRRRGAAAVRAHGSGLGPPDDFVGSETSGSPEVSLPT